MAKNNNLTDFLTDVANAIRTKKGTTAKINPQNFSSEISSIETGGGGGDVIPKASLNDVTFFDFNGHILYSYSHADFLALNAMPELPSRNGLECTGWTHTLEEAKEYVNSYRRLNIGACYTTSNGRTQIYFDVYSDENLTRKFAHSINIAKGVTVYYGDGKTSQNSGTGARVWTKNYSSKGSYVFEIEAADGAVLGLGYSGTDAQYKPFFGSDVFNDGARYPNGSGLDKIYCGNKITYYHDYFAARHKMLKELILTPAQSIGRFAFYETSIRCAIIPYGITSIGNQAFDSCVNLTNVVIPNSVTQLGYKEFNKAKSLRTIDLPTSITSIPEYCFGDCWFLEVATIPKTVTSIGYGAFANCYSLRLVNMSQHETVPTIDGGILGSYMNYAKFVVPDALYDEWVAATYWNSYSSQIIKKSEWEGQ